MNDILGGSWDLRRVKAFAFLALEMMARVFRRLFRGRKDDGGAALFLENFAGEGLQPLTLPHEHLLEAAGQCIHCGLCEAVCPLPVERWVAYSRALAQSVDAAASVPAACPADCGACVAVCPTHVPLAEMPAFVHRGRHD